MQFTTTLLLGGKTATGIRVPDEVMATLGGGKRIPVSVTINGTRYASTIATMRGEPMIPVSADIRSAAGIIAGDCAQADSPDRADEPRHGGQAGTALPTLERRHECPESLAGTTGRPAE
jgi:Domain of unknown function (DUF1905)